MGSSGHIDLGLDLTEVDNKFWKTIELEKTNHEYFENKISQVRYKVFNPVDSSHSGPLLKHEVKNVYNQVIDNVINTYTLPKVNTFHKKVFSDMLLAENYFNQLEGLPNITSSQLIEYLNSRDINIDAPVKYVSCALNLDNGEWSRYFAKDIMDGHYWVKIKQSKVTDLYEWHSEVLGKDEDYTWVQFNADTMEPESYYLTKIIPNEDGIDDVIEEKYNLPSRELYSTAPVVSENYPIPEDFQKLMKQYPQVIKTNVVQWGRKPYGRVITFLESEKFLEDDPLAADVEESFTKDWCAPFIELVSITKIETMSDGTETWSCIKYEDL
jgi:hypothetical protein